MVPEMSSIPSYKYLESAEKLTRQVEMDTRPKSNEVYLMLASNWASIVIARELHEVNRLLQERLEFPSEES